MNSKKLRRKFFWPFYDWTFFRNLSELSLKNINQSYLNITIRLLSHCYSTYSYQFSFVQNYHILRNKHNFVNVSTFPTSSSTETIITRVSCITFWTSSSYLVHSLSSSVTTLGIVADCQGLVGQERSNCLLINYELDTFW